MSNNCLMMKFAVIGGGVSGLTAAYLLSQRYPVTLFEASPRLGGHTHTVLVDAPEGRKAVDMGFIVFNEKNYRGFTKLLGRLAVETQPSEMSFSVSSVETGLEYRATSLDSVFAQRTNLFRPSFHRMLRDIVRFNGSARDLLHSMNGDNPTLEELVTRGNYSRRFLEHYLVPMGSAIWSADPEQMLSFPARYLLQFFANHGFLETTDPLPWRTVKGGSQSYVDVIVKPFADGIRLRAPVRAVRRFPAYVEISTDEGTERFDHVIIASHSDQALRMLADPTPREKAVLGAIRYQSNETVLHTDRTLLPRRKKAWASWNYMVPKEPTGRVNVTYYSNRLQSIQSETDFLVTLNRTHDIQPESLLEWREFHHPIYDFPAVDAQKKVSEVSGSNRTSYCGAYWGFGFHEDGVQSALAATRPFGVSL
jgi:uncharacterized protein